MQKISKAIDLACTWYAVPVNVMSAIIWQESRWGQLGDKLNMRSFDGGFGRGICQIDARFHPIASTFVENEDGTALKVPNDSIYDILLSVTYGTRLLSMLYMQYKNWDLAITRYNGSGPEADKYLQLIKSHMERKPWNV